MLCPRVLTRHPLPVLCETHGTGEDIAWVSQKVRSLSLKFISELDPDRGEAACNPWVGGGSVPSPLPDVLPGPWR